MVAKKITEENAADRMTYTGEIFSLGEDLRKQDILNNLPQEWRDLHESGYIHIHDLDAYGLTYNCLTVDLRKFFPYKRFIESSQEEKIIGVFDFCKEFLTKLGNEQSGGMAFANFDIELTDIFLHLNLPQSLINTALLEAAMRSFITWCNNSHERLGKVSYYISLNVGLAQTDFGRYICKTLLEAYSSTPALIYKPNIIFKIKKGINFYKNDPNYTLLQTALKTTTVKMIPTYLFCDAPMNSKIDPELLSIMGCRTRVADNKYGYVGAVGRGNITNISINLPRLAMEVKKEGNTNIKVQLDSFCNKWNNIALSVSKILEDRYETLVKNRSTEDFLINSQCNLWCVPFEDPLDGVFKNGTLSIGFIGLSEATEVLSGKKFYNSDESYFIAKQILKHMRKFTDNKRDTTRFNYSLLATSGEYISGRFVNLDIKSGYINKVTKKEFYTNSFHVEVDSGLSAFDKIKLEAKFHEYCNGGCISYIEFKEAPINNEQALEELIIYAAEQGIHYLGFNFDLDICSNCGTKGLFDVCTDCSSSDIIRVRRVSGYLEILDYFTKGKKKEVKQRRRNS